MIGSQDTDDGPAPARPGPMTEAEFRSLYEQLHGQVEKGWPAFLILSVRLNVACIAVTVFMLSRRRRN